MKFGLNRAQLKNIALVFMVLDNAYFRFSTAISSVAHLATRFVAPLFAWLMVDGFFHTKSRGRYCRRLWIAAALMQTGNVISSAIFGQNGIVDNIFLTLALSFTIIWLFELAKQEDSGKKIGLRILAIFLVLLGIAFSLVLFIPLPFGNGIAMEGGLQLIPFVLISYFFHDSKWKQAVFTLAYSLLMFFVPYGGPALFQNGFDMFCVNSDWMTFLVIPFMFLYNGREGKKSPSGKWFFYFFYPAHLWALMLLKVLL